MRRVDLPKMLSEILKNHGGKLIITWYYTNEGTTVETRNPKEVEAWAFWEGTWSGIDSPPVEVLDDDDAHYTDGESFYARARLNMSLREWRRLQKEKEQKVLLPVYQEEILAWTNDLAPRSFYGQSPYPGRFVNIRLDIVWLPDDWKESFFDGIEVTPRNIKKLIERGTKYLDYLLSRKDYRDFV